MVDRTCQPFGGKRIAERYAQTEAKEPHPSNPKNIELE